MTAADASRRLWYLSMEVPAEGDARFTHVSQIIAGLRRRGWQVQLWTPAPRSGQRTAVRRILDMLAVQARLLLTRRRPHALYVRGHFAALPAVLWFRARNVPVYWEVNGPVDDVLSTWPAARRVLWLMRLSTTLQLRLSTAVVAVTPQLAAASRRAGARRTSVVPNGADVDLFRPGASTDRDLPPTYVVFAGALAGWQGIGALVSATAHPDWPPAVTLVVAGDGPFRRVLEAGSGPERRIRALGRVPYQDVPGLLARSLAAVSPVSPKADPRRAKTGVVPLKLFEAMAAGVPVVVTDLPGQAEIVTSERCGIVVPADDPAALARAVRDLSIDRRMAAEMGRRGREAVERTYSWDAAADQIHRIMVAS